MSVRRRASPCHNADHIEALRRQLATAAALERRRVDWASQIPASVDVQLKELPDELLTNIVESAIDPDKEPHARLLELCRFVREFGTTEKQLRRRRYWKDLAKAFDMPGASTLPDNDLSKAIKLVKEMCETAYSAELLDGLFKRLESLHQEDSRDSTLQRELLLDKLCWLMKFRPPTARLNMQNFLIAATVNDEELLQQMVSSVENLPLTLVEFNVLARAIVRSLNASATSRGWAIIFELLLSQQNRGQLAGSLAQKRSVGHKLPLDTVVRLIVQYAMAVPEVSGYLVEVMSKDAMKTMLEDDSSASSIAVGLLTTSMVNAALRHWNDQESKNPLRKQVGELVMSLVQRRRRVAPEFDMALREPENKLATLFASLQL